jgi:hypothetical protein
LDGESTHTLFGKGKEEALEMVPILWKHYKDTGYLSARILAFIDEDTIKLVDSVRIEELVLSLPERPFEMLTTHDCFRVLPNYGNDLRTQYNRQLYEIARSDILSSILSQIGKRTITVGKLDETLQDDIMNAEYALS